MKINRDVLLGDLSKVIASLGVGATDPNNFFDFFNRDGITYLASANGNVITILKLDYNLPDIKVRGIELFSFIKSLSKDTEIEISFDYAMNISTETSATSIALCNDSFSQYGYVELPQSEKDWCVLPDNFINQLILASSSASSKHTGASTFDYVYAEGNKIVASNGIQIMLQYTEAPVQKMFVKNSYIKMLAKSNIDNYYIGSSWLVFRDSSNDVMTAFRTLDKRERYPIITTISDWSEDELNKRKGKYVEDLCDIKDGISVDFNGCKEDLKEASSRCDIFTKNQQNNVQASITLSYDNGVLEVGGLGKYGSHKQRIKAENACEQSFSFIINPDLLNNILSKDDLKFKMDSGRILLDNDSYKVVVALMKKK